MSYKFTRSMAGAEGTTRTEFTTPGGLTAAPTGPLSPFRPLGAPDLVSATMPYEVRATALWLPEPSGVSGGQTTARATRRPRGRNGSPTSSANSPCRSPGPRITRQAPKLGGANGGQTGMASHHGREAMLATMNEAESMQQRSERSFELLAEQRDGLVAELAELQRLYDKLKDPVHVAELCVNIRTQRPVGEQVRDSVEQSLNEVAACPKHGRRMIEQFMGAAQADLTQLNQLREKLHADVLQKSESVNVDRAAYSLDHGWTPPDGLAMLNSPVRLPGWRAENDNLNTDAQRAAQNAERLRCKAAAYRAELVATERSVRRHLTEDLMPVRLLELQEQIDRLAAEGSRVQAGQAQVEEARREVEDSIHSKLSPLSLAQSRLQVRQSRPEAESVRDHAERMLQQEVTDYQVAIQRLHQEVGRMQNEFDKLEHERMRLAEQTADKTQSLELEREVHRLLTELDGRMQALIEPEADTELYELKSGATVTDRHAGGRWR